MKHIGILGGGQLAQMTLQAVNTFSNVPETTILEKESANICKDLATTSIDGSLHEPKDIRNLVESVDITTYEIEHIDIHTLLTLEKEGQVFTPSPRVLEIIQDKGKQKDFFMKHTLPTAPYHIVGSPKDISSIVDQFSGEHIVIKSCTGGYDGKGVVVCKKDEVTEKVMFEGACVVEEYVGGAIELAVMVGRDMEGNSSCRDVVEMVFNEHNTLDYQLCPARVSPEIAQQTQSIALQAIHAFDGIGVFAVEFFLTQDGELLINEIAPRPHNSGHHTIDACVTSQFAQLGNILVGNPLGSTDIHGPSMMINLLGPANHEGSYSLVDEEALEDYPNVFVHIYGKQPSKPNRKLGHITIVGRTTKELLEQYEDIKHLLLLQPTHD